MLSQRTSALLLLCLSFLVYAGTISHEFTVDDAIVITENTFTQNADFIGILTSDTFAGYFNEKNTQDLLSGGRYRPLTLILFSIVLQFSADPTLFHALNVLMFAITTVVIFFTFTTLLKNNYRKKETTFIAFITALVFAAHPIHTEIVANVKGLDEILALLFSLLALMYSIKIYDTKRAIQHHIGVAFLFFLALLAKETAVAFIPIAFVAYYVFRSMQFWSCLRCIIPFVGAFIAYMILRTIALGDMMHVPVVLEPLNNPFLRFDGAQWVPLGVSEKLGTILYTLIKYIQLLVFPHPLTHDYYPWVIPVTPLNSIIAISSVLFYVFLVVLSLRGLWLRKSYAFGLTIFLCALFLVSNVPLSIGTLMAERFLFMPSLGFCFLVALMLLYVIQRLNGGRLHFGHFKSRMVVVIGGLVIGLGIWKTWDRSQDWASNFTLFQADIETSAGSAKLNNALAGELIVQSQKSGVAGSETAQAMLQQALVHLEKATDLHPTYQLAYMLKGNAHHYLGNNETAIDYYQHALAIDPSFADARKNLEMVVAVQRDIEYQQLEQASFQAIENGNYDQALTNLTRLINESPHTTKYLFFRSVTYANLAQFEQALVDFKAAEQADTGSDKTNTIRILQAIHNTHLQMGNQEAVEEYQSKLDALMR